MDWESVFKKLSIEDNCEDNFEDIKCLHTDIIEESEHILCSDCGEILNRILSSENQFSSTAVTRRRISSCPIYNDIPEEFDPAVKNLAVTIYKTVTIRRIYKSILRKSIIAACLYRSSVILNVSTRRCFSAFGLSNTEANRGIVFVSSNLPWGEFNIPLFGDNSEICAACAMSGILGDDVSIVINLFNDVKKNCEEIFASSQRISIVYGCVWTFIKNFESPDYPSSLSELINRLINENCNPLNSKTRIPVSAITIDRKYCEIMKYILSRVMKRVFSMCISMLSDTCTLISNTPVVPVTVYNCNDPDKISMIADDGFIYPLDDVDDILDWNILFDMEYISEDTIVNIPIKITSKCRTINVKFDKCPESVCKLGPNILNDEVKKFIRK